MGFLQLMDPGALLLAYTHLIERPFHELQPPLMHLSFFLGRLLSTAFPAPLFRPGRFVVNTG